MSDSGSTAANPGRTALRFLSPARISGLYVLVGMVVFFSFANDQFFTSQTVTTIASEQAVTAIVAMGLTVALAAGVFDLSIAGTMGLANIIVARLLAEAHWNTAAAILATIAVCSLIGIANGILVTKVRIDPFIATLGMNSVLAAVIYVISGNRNVLGIPSSFQDLAGTKIGDVPLPVFYVIALALVLWYVLEWTPIGRRLYATGGSREVARLAGIKTDAYVISSFVTSSVIAAAAGILVVARIGTGSTEVGPSYLLPAFAAGFLGSTQFRNGRFNIWGTVLAVYLLATGVKGLVLMGADFWVPDLFNGLALLLAVGLSGIQVRGTKRFRVRRRPPPEDALTEERPLRDAENTRA